MMELLNANGTKIRKLTDSMTYRDLVRMHYDLQAFLQNPVQSKFTFINKSAVNEFYNKNKQLLTDFENEHRRLSQEFFEHEGLIRKALKEGKTKEGFDKVMNELVSTVIQVKI